MNKPKVRQRYIDLHGDDRHYLKMLEKRNKEFADRAEKELGISREEAQTILDELDRMAEELDVDF